MIGRILPLCVLCLVGCGEGSGGAGADPAATASDPIAAPESRAEAGTPSDPAGPASASRDRLTAEYLEGRWCFSRRDGEGERGIYVFDAEGSYRVGIAWTGEDYHLEEARGIETFWQSYGGPVEVGPDRFVVLLSNHYEVVFERDPC